MPRNLVEHDRKHDRALARRAEDISGERDRVIAGAALGTHGTMSTQIAKTPMERAVDATDRELCDELGFDVGLAPSPPEELGHAVGRRSIRVEEARTVLHHEPGVAEIVLLDPSRDDLGRI